MVSGKLLVIILPMLWDPVYPFPQDYVCRGKSCNFSWTSLKKIPTFEQRTEEIIASHNVITSINDYSFNAYYENFISLINLDYNLLSNIEPSAFKSLQKLKYLSLRYNVIKELPQPVFKYIPNIIKIHLQGNKIRHLHPQLFQSNPKLQIVDISYNELKNVPSNIFKNNKLLSEVYLNNNEIKYLSSEIFQNNPNLKVAHLGNNKIKSVPSDLFLTNMQLKYANFSNNEITKFGSGETQQNCPSEHLDISGNKLDDFELCQIQCLEKPTKIDVSNNLISCDEEFRGPCFTSTIDIVNACDLETPTTASRRRKREEHSTANSSKNSAEFFLEDTEESSASIDHQANISQTSTINIILPISNTTNLITNSSVYVTGYDNSSDVYNETVLNSTSPTGQADFNMTTVITILQYDSPLVSKESTLRGFLFIGIECSLASALVLKKLLCFKDKKHSVPVDTIELLPASEQSVQNADENVTATHSV